MAEQVRVRQTEDAEGQRLLHIIRRGTGSVVYGVKQIAADGLTLFSVVITVVGVLVGVLVGWAFVRRQRVSANPLLDLGLFGSVRFNVAIVALVVNTGVMMGLNFFAAQHLQLVHSSSPLEAGLWTLPMTIAGIPVALLVPSVARNIRPA